MKKLLPGILCWVIGLFFSTSTLSEILVVDNFSTQVVLEKQSSLFYLVKGTSLKVELSNRLIVKTASHISRDEIANFHQQIVQVTELFKGLNTHYFSVKLKDQTKLGQVLKDLTALQNQNKSSGIMLVQPDMLQLKTSTETNVLSKKISPYISMLDIPALWQKTKGEGVKIAVIDDGINLNHEDLKHITPVFSYNVETGRLDSSPNPKIDGHGTKVAGIIFAAHNQIGIDGIAPEADLIALRQPDTWTSNTLLSFQLAKLAGASIINCSWHSQWLLEPIVDAVNELAEQGRDGKGIAVVFGAGNQGQEIKLGSNETAIDSAIVVAANDSHYHRLNFSNYGQSVDLITYGKAVKTTLASGKYGIFAGTSLSAAIVSGLSALLLSQNPEMTVKQLLEQLKLITKTNEPNSVLSSGGVNE